ncbi:hypothetical protein DCAR_0208035 [Daucus carota subsp. sativus]|uniref:Uncharacterized protein n=1 Tax=Daucus carota subsp. sativus TaxID=79200 RepID=A0A166E9X9_DAUCS|nr:hypothetical protein DCAR_0208035 [Daucus carota subsp. sativus]
MSAPGFVKEPTVVVGEREKAAVLKEYDNNLPDLGLRDQESDQDFVSICKKTLRNNPPVVASVVSKGIDLSYYIMGL